jgi:hypothetical protein
MRTLALSLAYCYSPEDVALVFVDPSDTTRRFFNYGSGETALDQLPHVLKTVSTPRELDQLIQLLRAEYDEEVIGRLKGRPDLFNLPHNPARHIFVIMDHYDEIESLNKGSQGVNTLSEVGKGKNLHFVICGTAQILRNSMDDLRRRAESARYTLVLQDYEAVRYMGARGTFTVAKEVPPGRGFLVKAVSATMVHAAMPVIETKDGLPPDERLSRLLQMIRAGYPASARWSYTSSDLAPLEAAIRGELAVEEQPADATTVDGAPLSTQWDDIAKIMAMQADFANQLSAVSEPGEFASVEIPDAAGEAPGGETPGGGTPDGEAADGQNPERAG